MALPQALHNALRQNARLCRAELLQSIKGKPATSRDAIITEVLDKYAARLNGIPSGPISPKSWLVYYVRQLSKG